MKKVICSYGDLKYRKSLEILEKTAYETGKVDQVFTYNREWIETTEFYRKNKYILDIPRGNGVWLWKPYIILETIKQLEKGDIVMYSDAGISVIDNLTPLFEMAQQSPNGGMVLFPVPGGHLNRTWTKRDCYILTDCDEEKYYNHEIINGAFSLWVKNENSIQFLNTWLRYLRDPRISTDEANICGKQNIQGFKEHRHDQSVLSLMAVKNNFKFFRDPTQFGNDDIKKFPNCTYGQLLNHHRGNI